MRCHKEGICTVRGTATATERVAHEMTKSVAGALS